MNYSSIIRKSPLFHGISDNELGTLIKCLGCSFKTFKKSESVYLAGDFAQEIGLVVIGRVHILQDDAWGNSNIIAEVTEGGTFAEAYTCGGVGILPVSVVAAAESEIMFFDFQRVTAACSSACVFHTLLIRNMIGVFARKNIILAEKIEHITKRTTREKLLSYLSMQAANSGSGSFAIPFNRQQLADYLSVERSALSAEMSKLKTDGIINYKKNHFELLSSALKIKSPSAVLPLLKTRPHS